MPISRPYKAVIFDWGDTIMRDFGLPGCMADWDYVEWIPGAEKVLTELSSKYTIIIATSAGHSGTPEMIAALRRVGADKYFDYFYSSKDLGFDKPDPSFFIQAAFKSGFKTADCVMVGNIYEKDIVGAKKAGMQTAFFNEQNLIGNFPDADAVFNHFEQLISILY